MNQYEYPPARAQIGNFNGATQQASGTSGLVPAPNSGDNDKFLKGDGTWDSVPSPAGKVDIAQGVGNAGKVMRVNSSGNLEPDDEQDISGKLDIEQGSANVGKVMRVNSSGELEPDDEQDISGKVNIAQGSANAGKILRIGSDGNLAVDGTMTILSYGHSTWNDFTTAYNSKSVVYCRASSSSNPASGSQTRLAFMAYVNNADNPTEVEFQYYRSVSSHTASQQGDQVFVYKLTSNGTWTVTTREASVKVVAGSNISGSYSNGTMTISGNYSAFSSGNSGLVPAPASGDSGKFLKGDGTWETIPPEVNWYNSESDFPATGSAGILYVAKDTNEIFRWDTTESEYVAISSAGNALKKVVFSIETTDWTAVSGGYSADVSDSSIALTSEEIVIYDESLASLTSNIGYTKSAGTITFFVESLPSGTISGKILTVVGSIEYDNKLDKNQGSVNAGKFMKVNSNGELVPDAVPKEVNGYNDITYFPATGVDGNIYIAKDTGMMYRWDGSEYTPIGGMSTGVYKAVINFATTDWSAVSGGYSITLTDQNIDTDSEEIVIFDESVESLTSNITYEKNAASHSIVFTVATLPTGTIRGRVLIISGSLVFDGKIDSDQGIQNAGKVMKVGQNGIVTPENISVLPEVSSSDNGKILSVVNGVWTAVTLEAWQGGSY